MRHKVGLLGATGRMGLEIAALLARNDSDLELADAVSSSKRYRSIEGVELRALEEPPREPVHLWIDFSTPTATLRLLEMIRCPIVIGTTGFTESDRTRILRYAESQPVCLAANTSPGMAVMRSLLREVPEASVLPWDVVLEETHHRHKKDAPSGTAKALMEILRDKGFSKVEVHVTRAGEIVGTHTVRLISDDEEITIEHRAVRREAFAKGALAAARFLIGREPGLYGMDDVFKRGEK